MGYTWLSAFNFTMEKVIPTTVLTGYLGAGKTTLLNRILTYEHGKKVAVIVNEFGEVGIDHQLVINADEEVFEMNNGCICCTVRGDLIRIINNLLRRRHKFDHLLIETTGLAEPGPVIQTFFVDEDIRRQVSLDAVVTLVDAKHIGQHWQSEEVEEQIAFADIVLINKTDLVTDAELQKLNDRIRSMNALCRIYPTQNAEIEIDRLLGVGAFDLDRVLSIDPHFLTKDHDHDHEEDVFSVALVEEGALDLEKLNEWLGELLQTNGSNIFRMKGILNIHQQAERFVFQGVHMMFDGRPDRLWQKEEARRNEIVFIGRNLDREALTRSFRACLVK